MGSVDGTERDERRWQVSTRTASADAAPGLLPRASWRDSLLPEGRVPAGSAAADAVARLDSGQPTSFAAPPAGVPRMNRSSSPFLTSLSPADARVSPRSLPGSFRGHDAHISTHSGAGHGHQLGDQSTSAPPSQKHFTTGAPAAEASKTQQQPSVPQQALHQLHDHHQQQRRLPNPPHQHHQIVQHQHQHQHQHQEPPQDQCQPHQQLQPRRSPQAESRPAAPPPGGGVPTSGAAASATSHPPAELTARLNRRSGRSAVEDVTGTTSGWFDKELIDLADRMAHGVQLKDRYRRLRKYSNCFTGREGVAWLLQSGAVSSEQEAVEVGDAMMHLGLLNHVKFQLAFAKRGHFYRFSGVGPGAHDEASTADEKDRGSVHRSWRGPRAANTDSKWQQGQEVARLQRRAADAAAEAKVLRAADGVLHEGQLCLARRQRRLQVAIAQVAAQQQEAAQATALAAFMQAGAVALLVVMLLALYGHREGCPHAPTLQHLRQAEVTGGGGPGGGGIVHGHGRASSPKTWLLVAAMGVSIMPLLYCLWDAYTRLRPPADRGGGRAGRRRPADQTSASAALERRLLGGSDSSARLTDGSRSDDSSLLSATSSRRGWSTASSTAGGGGGSVDGGGGGGSVGIGGNNSGARGSVVDEGGGEGGSRGGRHSGRGRRRYGSREVVPQTLASDSDYESGSSEEGPSVPEEDLFRGWCDAPGLLRLKPGVGQHLTDGCDPGRIPLNCDRPIMFESEDFVGKAAIWVRNLPSSPPGLFKGQRRKSRVTVQGQFKRRICMDDVITGQEFNRATNLPAQWLVDQVLIKVAKRINPSVEIGPMSAPSVLVPVIAMAQSVVVSRRGEEPLLTQDPLEEDCSLLGDALWDADGAPVDAGKRKAHFGSVARRKAAFFEPGLVYSFDIVQHLVDLSSYELDLAMYKFDLSNVLDGQPLQFMMRERGHRDRPLFAFEIWHEKLLPAARRAA